MKTKMSISTVLSLIAVAALTACGGGSGGGAAGDSTSQPDTVVAPPTPIAYKAGSEELAVFTLLNAERKRCDFYPLVQNARLDKSAKGHADWLLKNDKSGHYQTTGTPLFTGATPYDREAAAGYGEGAAFTDSEVEFDSTVPKFGQGTSAVRNFLNAPYHQLAMLRGYRDVGVSVRGKFDIGVSPNNRSAVNIDFGYLNSVGLRAAPADTVRTYPCEGSTGVNRFLEEETPNPVPTRNLRTDPLGSTIGVVGDVGTTLTITSASMTNVSSGASVALRTPVTAATDPNATGGTGNGYIYPNEGYILADAPLDASTAYKATITGTNNGKPFTKKFTFVTGSGTQR